MFIIFFFHDFDVITVNFSYIEILILVVYGYKNMKYLLPLPSLFWAQKKDQNMILFVVAYYSVTKTPC